MEFEDFEAPSDRVAMYKGFTLTHKDPYGYVTVTRPNGGKIPASLEGDWTGMYEAQKKIDWYVASQEQKENAPPQDKHLAKVLEVIKEGPQSAPVKEPSTAKEALNNAFAEAKVTTKKYKSK